MESFEFRFTPTVEDYSRAVRAFYVRQGVFSAVLACLAVFAICGLILRTMTGSLDAEPAVVGLVTTLLLSGGIVAAIILIMFLLVQPWLFSRQVQHNERWRSETVWRFTDDDIAVRDMYAQTTLDWGTFRRVIETRTHFLLLHTLNKNMFHILPKRAFESIEQQRAFRAFLAQHIADTRFLRDQQQPLSQV